MKTCGGCTHFTPTKGVLRRVLAVTTAGITNPRNIGRCSPPMPVWADRKIAFTTEGNSAYAERCKTFSERS